MKSLPFLFIFLFLLTPLISYSQEFESGDLESVSEEEAAIASEDIAAVEAIGEERQEDMIHPESEADWSLGGEDLPTEEYE